LVHLVEKLRTPRRFGIAFKTGGRKRDLLVRHPKSPIKTSAAPKRPKSEVVAFHPSDEAKLLRHVVGNSEWEAVVLFAFDAGCRQAEILGLPVKDIDFEAGSVTIRQTCDTINGKPVLKMATKTDASVRTIRLSRRTLEALALVLSQKNAPTELVFTDDGKPFTRIKFYTRWVALLKAAGVPHYHFHSTRHTMATRLLRSGAYLTAVSRRMGHSKPSITLDIYSSAIPEDQAPLADAFDLTLAKYGVPQAIGSQIGSREQKHAA
jgi:integrase